MRDWNQQFGANNSRCNGGVDIPVNDNPIRLVFNNDRFKSSDDLTGLLGVTARPHFQVDVRSRHPQLLEEDVRHAEVVMLSRMDKSLRYALLSRQGLQDRRRLHEIRPRSNNVKDMHVGGSDPYIVDPWTTEERAGRLPIRTRPTPAGIHGPYVIGELGA